MGWGCDGGAAGVWCGGGVVVAGLGWGWWYGALEDASLRVEGKGVRGERGGRWHGGMLGLWLETGVKRGKAGV